MKKILLSIVLFCSPIIAKELHFGVFAYLGYEKTKQKYEPLVKYLNDTLDYTVRLHVLTHEQMLHKVQNKQLDIATTNATNFLLFRSKYELSGAVATLVTKHGNTPVKNLGGVMFVRSDSTIFTMKDFKNKTVSTPQTTRMGGFRTQAYELYKNGIDVFSYTKKIITSSGDHYETVRNVLSKKADIGFVRDGILETMVQNKELDLKQLRIINPKKDSNHPFIVSTSLYPEWPVFAFTHVDESRLKSFIAALYNFNAHSQWAKDSQIYGYGLPADYLETEELNRKLRLPPFDEAMLITYKDIWRQHDEAIIVFIVAFVLISGLFLQARQRKNRLQSLLNHIGEGVYGTDAKGNCTWINTKALEILGYELDEVYLKNQHKVFHHRKTNGQSYDEIQCPIYQTIQDKKQRVRKEHFITKDNRFVPVLLTVAPTSDGGAIVVFRDITKEIEQEKRLQKLNRHLQDEVQKQVEQLRQKEKMLQEQAKLAAMGEMISAIAHQWRQPINALGINIQNLEEDYAEGLIDERFLNDFIKRQTKTINFMSKTIDDFRSFFKTDKEKTDFSVKEAILNVNELLSAQFTSHGIAVEMNGEDFVVCGYQSEMKQAILNILNNAKDAIVENAVASGLIVIYISKALRTITITDNGGGAGEDILDRIFEPYFTTKEQGKGTGIGLHMSRIIVVEHMKGAIKAFNCADGLCVEIALGDDS